MVAGVIRADDGAILAEVVLASTRHLAGVIMLEHCGPGGDAADAAVSFCLKGVAAFDDLPATMRNPAAIKKGG
jgi:hypothetical protein